MINKLFRDRIIYESRDQGINGMMQQTGGTARDLHLDHLRQGDSRRTGETGDQPDPDGGAQKKPYPTPLKSSKTHGIIFTA
jgi:hypothetical protein